MKWIKRILLGLLIVAIGFAGTLTYDGYAKYREALSETSLSQKVESVQSMEDYVTNDAVCDAFLNAIVAIEDHRFYEHSGIDFISLVRVTIANLFAQEIVAGGSTITQQLAKNLYFDQSQSWVRKISEAFVAHDLEQNYTKDEILELYINCIYYGDGYYGIYEASMGYFGVEPSELTLAQAAILAGLPQAPSVYALSTNLSGAKERQEEVLAAMLEYGYIDEDEYASAMAEDIVIQE